MDGSVDAQGRAVSHEAIYRWIYAHPAKTLREQGIMLRSKRTRRAAPKKAAARAARIVGMVSIDDRPDVVADRRVPGWWEGDLIIGAGNRTAAVTLVERTTRHTLILALPDGKKAHGVADALIESPRGLPDFMRQGLTWDQGTEMAHHASVNHPRYGASWTRCHRQCDRGVVGDSVAGCASPPSDMKSRYWGAADLGGGGGKGVSPKAISRRAGSVVAADAEVGAADPETKVGAAIGPAPGDHQAARGDHTTGS